MSLRLPVLGEHLSRLQKPGLGINLELPRFNHLGVLGVPRRAVGPTPVFGFDLSRTADAVSSAAIPVCGASANVSSAAFSSMASEVSIELLDLVEGSATLKTRLKTISTAVDAILSGKELADDIAKAKASGQSEEEAVACQTVKAITQGILGQTFTGAITAGIPTYLAAAQIDPRLQATLPIVLPLLPCAYLEADRAAKAIGRFAEGVCHVPFH